jgi:hypothetical protein
MRGKGRELKAKLKDILERVEADIQAHKKAGRQAVANDYLELVSLVRQMFDKEKARWRKWYDAKGKDAQLRRKIREALK